MADAHPQAGLGHIARCTALADALEARGVEVRCCGLDGAEARVLDGRRWDPVTVGALADSRLVLDTYRWRPTAGVAVVATFADEPHEPPPAAVTVAVSSPPRDGWLTGLAYACLRREYWDRVPRDEAPHSVLVTAGGGALADIGAEMAAAVARAAPGAIVRLLAPGDAPAGVQLVAPQPSLASELRRACVVVSLAGQTALEAAASGAASVVMAAVENQRPQAKALAEAGVAVLARTPAEAGEVAAELLEDVQRRTVIGSTARAAVDGRGAARVAEAIELEI